MWVKHSLFVCKVRNKSNLTSIFPFLETKWVSIYLLNVFYTEMLVFEIDCSEIDNTGILHAITVYVH